MNTLLLEAKASLQIQRSAEEVFDAIVNPAKMTRYFISKSTGWMEEGKDLVWNFPEFNADAPVKVGKVEQDKYVSFYWDNDDGTELFVEIALAPQPDGSTVVYITEKGMENNEEGIAWLTRNTEGWTNFLACLKAYLEYGISLRQGAFDFMRDNT